MISPDYRVAYDAQLVEEAVLLAEPRLSAAERAAFRTERDRVYEVEDPDEREARFEAVHGRWFILLGLDRPLHEVLGEFPELLQRTRACRVLPAICQRDEMADVRAEAGARPDTPPPTIVARLRPQLLLDQEAVRRLLRRELLHVADMLDPAFGYEKELPRVDQDPAVANLLRERYRVVWDTTIDGRLYRAGRLGRETRAARLREFSATFGMLGAEAETAFAAFFDHPQPAHDAMVAFVESPAAPRAGPTPPPRVLRA